MTLQQAHNIEKIKREVSLYTTAWGIPGVTTGKILNTVTISVNSQSASVDPYIAELDEFQKLIYCVVRQLVIEDAISRIHYREMSHPS